MKKRDQFWDVSKGLLILSVIHTHTTFYSGSFYLSEWFRNVSLMFDVPALFFISGYLVYHGSAAQLSRRIGRQLIRLIRGYLIVALLCILLYALYTNDITNLTQSFRTIFKLNLYGVVWDFFYGFTGSLWFLRVYLTILPIVFLLSPLIIRKNGILILTITTFLLFVITRYVHLNYRFILTNLPTATFYLFLMFSGGLYRQYESHLTRRTLILSFFCYMMLFVIMLTIDGRTNIIQQQKFPPSLPYLIYGSLPIALIVFLRPHAPFTITQRYPRLTALCAWCGRNIYTIYLWQGVIISIPLLAIEWLMAQFAPFILYPLILIFNVTVTLTVAYLYTMLGRIVD